MVERYHPPAKKGPHRFKKGDRRPVGAGRPKGQRNRTTMLFNDFVSGALEKLGHLQPVYALKADGTRGNRIAYWEPELDDEGVGVDGTLGYLVWLGAHRPELFVSLVLKTMPTTIQGEFHTQAGPPRFSDAQLKVMTLAEKIAAFKDVVGSTKALASPSPGEPSMLDGEVVNSE